MAGTYFQLYIQLVFAVKAHHSSLLRKEWKDEVEKILKDSGIYILNDDEVINLK